MERTELELCQDALANFQAVHGALNMGLYFGEHSEAISHAKAFCVAQIRYQESKIAELQPKEPDLTEVKPDIYPVNEEL